MPESIDVVADDQIFASEFNALRDDALRLLLTQGIGASETLISAGALTISSDNIGFVLIGAESGVADDLLTMTVTGIGNGDVIVLKATAGDTITIKADASPATNEFNLSEDRDAILSGDTLMAFVRISGYWEHLWTSLAPLAVWGGSMGQVDGGVIGVDSYFDVPFMPGVYLLGIYAMADASGSISIDIRTETFGTIPDSADSIGTSPCFAMSSVQTKAETTFTSITRKQSAGCWRFIVTVAATTIEQLSIVCVGVRI